MDSQGFSVGEMVKKGWRLMRRHMAFFIGFLIIYIGITIIPGLIESFYPHLFWGAQVAIKVIFYFLSLLLWIGFIKSALKVVDGNRPTYADLVSGLPVIVQFFIASIIYGLIVLVGLVLLIFPAAIWGSRYFLWSFLIVDKGVGPITALEMSGEMTMGVKWDVFMLSIATTIIVILGMLCFLVGWFVALPAATLAQVVMYRKLESKQQSM